MCKTETVTLPPDAQRPECACGQPAAAAAPATGGRIAAAAYDLMMPEVRFPSSRVFAACGETMLRELALAQHVRMRNGELARMFPSDAKQFSRAVEKAADFLVESAGGPAAYTERHGGGCMRTRHFPFTIDERAREVWLSCLWLAFDDVCFPAECREEVWEWLEAMSVRMINRRTQKAQPIRYPFRIAGTVFGKPVPLGRRGTVVCPR